MASLSNVIWLVIALLIPLCFPNVGLLPRLLRWNSQRRNQQPSPLEPSKLSGETAVTKESDFPADWWTGEKIHELEQRAIFSKSWLYVTHRGRFSKPGDYRSFELAGFPFFIILGRDGQLRAFHNVCRHRAYSVTRKESGCSTVLGCRYHGWSYDTLGRLTKAPEFDKIPGFRKEENSLWPVRTHVTRNGLVFVNFNRQASESDKPDWGVNAMRLAESQFLSSFEMKGNFNWKLTATANPFPTPANGFKFWPTKVKDEAYHFPCTSFYFDHAAKVWSSVSFVPISASRTSIIVDVYQTKLMDAHAANERMRTLVTERLKYLEKSHIGLVRHSQEVIEKIDWMAQNQILDTLKEHFRLERESGEEIYPARVQSSLTPQFSEADQLCRALDRMSGTIADLGSSKRKDDSLAW